jgi:hypothetical protein
MLRWAQMLWYKYKVSSLLLIKGTHRQHGNFINMFFLKRRKEGSKWVKADKIV